MTHQSACRSLALILLACLALSACAKATPTPTAPSGVANEEISWPIGETTCYATVTGPTGAGPYPAVVFIPGSGPTDRNWNSPLLPGTNGSAKLLAQALAEAGYVTIRYDKRFTGQGSGDNLPKLIGNISLESHRVEVAGAVDALLARPDVNPQRIYVLANSEGCIHALVYQQQATDKRFAGLVLAAPPGQSMIDLLRAQVNPQLTPLPGGAKYVELFNAALDQFVATGSAQPDSSLPEGVRNLISSLTTPANLPFTREIMPLDPAPLLAAVPEPVLVLIGKRDLQVNWEVDGKRLEEAAAGRDHVTFVYPPEANHILKHEATPRAQLDPAKVQMGYNAESATLDAEALQAILDWLKARE